MFNTPRGVLKYLVFFISMNKIFEFLKDVRIELSKVSWPTKEQTIQYTMVVIGLSFAIAIFLGGIDFGLEWSLNKFILK